jgi:hypothetical protein
VKSVKTNGGIVILKNGKVSCSCCGGVGDCCMYPAEFLGSLFGFEDLPDKLRLGLGGFYQKLEEPTILTSLNNLLGEGYFFTLYYGGEGFAEGVGIGSNSTDFWSTTIDFSPEEYSRCLILDDKFDSGPPIVGSQEALIYDDFEDIYYFTDEDSGAFDIPLNRISLCVWESDEWLSYENFGPSQTDYYGKAFLYYVENMAEFYGSSFAANALGAPQKSGFVFTVAEYVGGGFIGYKQDPQNEPNGDYTILKSGPFRTETLEITK